VGEDRDPPRHRFGDGTGRSGRGLHPTCRTAGRRDLTLPRTVVPSFAANTLIVGADRPVEAYEERLGFLSAVEPKLLGVELAYGGYFAANVLDVNAFAELTYS
jgi:hypothetical protein